MKHLNLDLSSLDLTDVAVIDQDGKGMPEFAASCGTNCNVANSCSCTVEKKVIDQA